MKIYKLLILLLAVTGLHSCTEYLDNGKKYTGPEPGEIPEFVAGLADESIKYYVGDTVVLKATLNDVDVTSTTIFKVNGIELKRDYSPKNGNIYVARNIGDHSVVATLDDFMDSFTFTKIGRAHVELQSRPHLVCRLLLEKKKKIIGTSIGEDHTYMLLVRHDCRPPLTH